MTADAITGQAVVPGLDRLQNPQMSMLDGHDVSPGRRRLPRAEPVPAEQLDDDSEKQAQQRVAGQLRQSDVEPKLLNSGLAHVTGGFSRVSIEQGPMGFS